MIEVVEVEVKVKLAEDGVGLIGVAGVEVQTKMSAEGEVAMSSLAEVVVEMKKLIEAEVEMKILIEAEVEMKNLVKIVVGVISLAENEVGMIKMAEIEVGMIKMAEVVVGMIKLEEVEEEMIKLEEVEGDMIKLEEVEGEMIRLAEVEVDVMISVTEDQETGVKVTIKNLIHKRTTVIGEETVTGISTKMIQGVEDEAVLVRGVVGALIVAGVEVEVVDGAMSFGIIVERWITTELMGHQAGIEITDGNKSSEILIWASEDLQRFLVWTWLVNHPRRRRERKRVVNKRRIPLRRLCSMTRRMRK